MNRRDLLKYLLATPLAATFDYERLLWVPGQMVTVPSVPGLMIRPDWIDYVFSPITVIYGRSKNTLITPQQIGKELAAIQRAALSTSS